MAGLATHLIVAREVLNLLPENMIKDKGDYYTGSIAPDAIHSRVGFIRADKKHTHLRDNIPDDNFHEEENLCLFHSRISEMIVKCKEKEEYLDFYRGYLVHLLTDELFVLNIRKNFTELMMQRGVATSDQEYYTSIVTDMHRIDFLLLEQYEGIDDIKLSLENARDLAMEGLLSMQEIRDSKNWVINRYFANRQQSGQPDLLIQRPEFINYDRMLEFIPMAAEDIAFRLSGKGNLPKIL